MDQIPPPPLGCAKGNSQEICLMGQCQLQICLIKSVLSNKFDHKFDHVGPALLSVCLPVTRKKVISWEVLKVAV